MIQSIKKEATSTNSQFSLKFLIREPKINTPVRKAVVLLHGVGSNEKDLFSLSNQLPDDWFVISPRGPFTIGQDRYAWYQVDFSTGKPIINAEQEKQSRKLIIDFIREIKQELKIDEIYLGGFSQGAIMSYSLGLTHPDEIQGIVSLSGRLLEEIKPFVKNDENLKRLKVFLAHGIHDNTLPVHYAREAKEYLQSLGVRLSYHEYAMGHQINNEVLNDMKNWLNDKQFV